MKPNKRIYRFGATTFYNCTELLAYALTYRKTPQGVLYEKRIKYGEEKFQYYNTYCREDLVEEEKPLFIYIHGGGFISGITDMRDTYIQNFAKKGFFTASLSYTYAPKKVYPAQLQEICSAVDCILDQAEERKIDSSRVLLAGESAGVYYMFMLCALSRDKALAERIGIRFRHAGDFTIRAMISHSGCYNLRNVLDENYPQSKYPDIKMMTCSYLGKNLAAARAYLDTPEGQDGFPHFNKDFPPTFFATGAADPLRHESYDAMKVYDCLGIPYAHYEGTGAIKNHAWTIVTVLKKGRECLYKTMEFIKPYLFDGEKDE